MGVVPGLAPITRDRVLGSKRQVFDRVRPGVNQVTVPATEAEERNLMEISVPFIQPHQLNAVRVSNVVLAEIAI